MIKSLCVIEYIIAKVSSHLKERFFCFNFLKYLVQVCYN